MRQAQIMQVLGTKYEGDTASVKVKRGSEELNFANLQLTGLLTALGRLSPSGAPASVHSAIASISAGVR